MSTLNDFSVVDFNTDVLAEYYNKLLGSIFRKEFSNAVTMTTDITLTDGDVPIQRLDCNGANRVVTVPASANGNHPFMLINTTSSGSWTLTVKSNDGADTLKTLDPGEQVYSLPDGNGEYIDLVQFDGSVYVTKDGLTEWDEQGSDPSTPTANKWKLFFKAGGMYFIDDAGTVVGPLGTGGGGSYPCFTRASVVNGDPNPADYLAQTSIYVFPYGGGNTYQQWNGSAFASQVFAALTLAMNAAHLGGSVYDVYQWNDGGTVRVVTGPAWATSTSRGTGAGTAEIESLYGVDVNKVQMTVRNGASTYTMPARYGTLVATITPSTNGQINWTVTKRELANRYNLLDANMSSCPAYQNDNTTDTWAMTGNGNWQKANGGSGSDLVFALCAPQAVRFAVQVTQTIANYNLVGVAFDITIPTQIGYVYNRYETATIACDNLGLPLSAGKHTASFVANANSGTNPVYLADEGRVGAASADQEISKIFGTVRM